MADGKAPGAAYSVISPSMVTRPTRSTADSVNHIAPSAPAAMPNGPPSGVGGTNAEEEPSGVIRPMRCVRYSVNHIAPSGPAAISVGPAPTGWTLTFPSPGSRRATAP